MRLRHAPLTAALLLALVLPAQAGSNLIRLTDRDELFGWEAVGRVELGREGYCTGALIAPNLVLTAAHCVYDRKGQLRPVEDMRFRAGLADGKAISDNNVIRVAAHKAYNPKSPFGPETIKHDAALLELETPISTQLADPFILHQHVDHGQKVSVVSYGRGRDAALSWQRSCSVLGKHRSLIAFDCNVTYGSSGAPVFVRENGRARILSLISGGGAGTAYGMNLPPLVAELKRDLRAMPKVLPTANTSRRAKVGEGGGASGAKFAKP